MAATKRWYDTNVREFMLAFVFVGRSSLRPCGDVFQGAIIQGRGPGTWHRSRFAVFRPDIHVIGHRLGNLFEHRRYNLPTVIAVFWFIHHYRYAKLGVVSREEADERGEVLPLEVALGAAGLFRSAGLRSEERRVGK